MSVLEKLGLVDQSKDNSETISDTEFDPIPEQRQTKTNTKKPGASRGGRPTRSEATRKETSAEINAYLTLLAATWSLRDDYCPAILSQTSAQISERLVDILMDHPRILEWFRQGTQLGKWILFFQSCLPVLQAIASHHKFGAGANTGENSDSGATNLHDTYPPFRYGTG